MCSISSGAIGALGPSLRQISKGLRLSPHPSDVGALVESLVASEWPTSEQQRLDWFVRHELDVEDWRREWAENGSAGLVGKGPDRWGSPSFGWHTFKGQFVGVSWFLWHGGTPEAVGAAARQLRDLLTGFAGAPVDELTTDAHRFAAFWEVNGRTIDMYLHGGPVLDGALVEDPVVQLHVDHTARAHLADEAHVRAQEGAPSHRNG